MRRVCTARQMRPTGRNAWATDVRVSIQAHGTASATLDAELAAIADVAARRALQPVYQPIFSQSGQPIGFEGLVRPGFGVQDGRRALAAAG
jgi:EAL domain-containing protein (putative c-di-GMP-specific phosphodiesterase class I)